MRRLQESEVSEQKENPEILRVAGERNVGGRGGIRTLDQVAPIAV